MQKAVILILIRPREGEDFLNLIITWLEITMSFNIFQKVALLRNRRRLPPRGEMKQLLVYNGGEFCILNSKGKFQGPKY